MGKDIDKQEINKMNYLDLFSGIGGFALGAYWAGFKAENHFYSEIDKYAIDIYQKRFPDSIYLGDIKKIDCDELKKHEGEWVITGGFPCQDISIAGKGVGLDGARSGLWFEMWRIIRELRPKFVIAENVSAITFRGLDRVVSSLAEIGYSAEWNDIRASDMGAPHRRERIWIIAYPTSIGLSQQENKQIMESKRENKFLIGKPRNKREVAYANADSFNGSESGKQHIGTKEFNGSSANELEARNDVENSDGVRLQRQRTEQQTTGIIRTSKKVANANSTQCKGDGTVSLRGKAKHSNIGLSSWWSIEPNVGGMVDGLSARMD